MSALPCFTDRPTGFNVRRDLPRSATAARNVRWTAGMNRRRGRPLIEFVLAIARSRQRQLLILLAAQSTLIVLLSINRLSPLTDGFVASNQFLRWVDLLNLLLSLASVVLTYLLLRAVRQGLQPARAIADRVFDAAFAVGAWLYAAGYGDHETTNYLHERFCPTTAADLCRIIAFHDDTFSHLLFFAGFIILAIVVMAAQTTYPDPRPLGITDHISVLVNGLISAAGVVANLAFEDIGLDLYVVAVVAATAITLLILRPTQVILRYYTIAFVAGLLVTGAIKAT
ncbi:hypothetical protein ACIA5C_45130 [Actinoplanes sp. NPDC051343]|uniref:hypothetical protein n=1 Tax=Actinoplanes sp. NPDC051343 TaxID=3363906 RepID=UPI0037B7A0C9